MDANKLDDIVSDQLRTPDEYLEPLTGVPHPKLRIGQFRLGTACDHEEQILDVYFIEHRRHADKADEDYAET